jgi:hypothetical protein
MRDAVLHRYNAECTGRLRVAVLAALP